MATCSYGLFQKYYSRDLDYKDDDGFLYINYDVENTFGNDYFKKDDIENMT